MSRYHLVEHGDDWFKITGDQLFSLERVQMLCKYRGDGGPARFHYKDQLVEATVPNVVSTDGRRCTTVGAGDVRIEQVEHILSALFGMGVLDSDIELAYENTAHESNRISPPVCDLGARDFSTAIVSAFHKRPHKAMPQAHIDQLLVVRDDDSSNADGSIAVFAPLKDHLHVTCHVNFDNFIGQQFHSDTITPLRYLQGICWARSFFATCFPHRQEWDELRRQFPGVIREKENHFRSLMIDYGTDGWITPVLANTEPARHKLLDFLGDIALVGLRFSAGVHIYKPYHEFNRKCARELLHALRPVEREGLFNFTESNT